MLRDDEGRIGADKRRRFLNNIVEDSGRLDRLVGRLRDLAKAENPQPGGRTTPAAVLEQLNAQGRADRVRMHGDTDTAIGLSTDNAAIVLGHLVDNACEQGATRIDIDVSKEDNALVLLLSDDGPGISEQNRDRIFDAFFTTKRDQGGTGMGLTIVRSLLEAHGGA